MCVCSINLEHGVDSFLPYLLCEICTVSNGVRMWMWMCNQWLLIIIPFSYFERDSIYLLNLTCAILKSRSRDSFYLLVSYMLYDMILLIYNSVNGTLQVFITSTNCDAVNFDKIRSKDFFLLYSWLNNMKSECNALFCHHHSKSLAHYKIWYAIYM